MIILDLSQVMLSNILAQLGNHTNAKVEESMVRHMVLNSIRSYRTKYGNTYGELVIACDNKNYWRRELFPYYKANRKKNIEKSEFDWKSIFECLGKIRQELKDFFPYRIIEIETAEADDIIGSLCMKFGVTEDDWSFEQLDQKPILILSGDHDFIQLHKYTNVEQFDPVKKKKITHNNPKVYLKEHIIRGDVGDGIPNFLSPDNCLVLGQRQKPIMNKKLQHWVKQQPEQFCTELQLRNYRRNEQLIDLSKIPENIYNMIIESYESQNNKKTKDLMSYFMNNNLKMLMESINEFV
jgi:hypothetical protein